MIEAAAGRTEKERKIPADVLSAMHACGLFHMLLPVSLGGAAVDLVTFNFGPRLFTKPHGIGASRPVVHKSPRPIGISRLPRPASVALCSESVTPSSCGYIADMAQRLTDAQIKRLAPPAQASRIIYDALVHGFGVRITAAGARSFVLN